ncbi:hypothetical protein J6590_052736 [Homalodisca vitripennis]|nr:hypothetical protein J6590_052736 [Homalodisca vitripennis]
MFSRPNAQSYGALNCALRDNENTSSPKLKYISVSDVKRMLRVHFDLLRSFSDWSLYTKNTPDFWSKILDSIRF